MLLGGESSARLGVSGEMGERGGEEEMEARGSKEEENEPRVSKEGAARGSCISISAPRGRVVAGEMVCIIR